MDLQQLRCYLAVAETLHFGRAAELLHLSPSPVSRAIKELERELEVPLFVRSYHRVELTAAGKALIEPVKRIVEVVDDLSMIAVRASDPGLRVLRLGATYQAPPALVDRFIGLVESTFPGHRLDVASNATTELISDLDKGHLDAAMVLLPVESPLLDTLVMAQYPFYVIVCADDPLTSADILSLEALVDRTMTTLPLSAHPPAVRQIVDQIREAGIHQFHQMATPDSSVLAAHIRHKRGLTLSLHPSTGGPARVFDDPAYTAIPLRAPAPELRLGLAWRRADAVRDDVVTMLVDAVRREQEHKKVAD